MKPTTTAGAGMPRTVVASNAGLADSANVPPPTSRPPLVRTRARLIDTDAVASAYANVVPKMIVVPMNGMQIATGNDYISTRGMTFCCALIVCADRHPVTGRYAQRALFHVVGAADFNGDGLGYVDEMLALVRGATHASRFVLCLGDYPVSRFAYDLLVKNGSTLPTGETRRPFRELRLACSEFAVVQAADIEVTPTGMLYDCEGEARPWQPSGD